MIFSSVVLKLSNVPKKKMYPIAVTIENKIKHRHVRYIVFPVHF